MKPNYYNYTCEELWQLFLNGDATALDRIVKSNYNLLYNYGCKFTTDAELVKDCIQELFLTLWKTRNNLNNTGSVKHYLMKAFRRKLERALSTAHTSYYPEFMNLAESCTTSPEIKKILEEEYSGISARLLQAIGNLSNRQQEIIYLRFYLDANAIEIAAIMDLSKQSVYNLLQVAIARLRTETQMFSKTGAASIIFLFAALNNF